MSIRTRVAIIATDEADAEVRCKIGANESRRARIRVDKIVVAEFDAYSVQADMIIWAVRIFSASDDRAADTADTSEPFWATTISTRCPASTIDTNHSIWTIVVTVRALRAADSIYTYPTVRADALGTVRAARAEDRRQANATNAFVSRRAFCCITRGIAVSFEALEAVRAAALGTISVVRALRAADAVRGTREARRAGVGVSVSITSYCWVADAFDTDVSRRALLIGTGRIADAVVAHKSVWA